MTDPESDKPHKPGHTGIGRIIAASRYSSEGLAAAWRNEAAFRQEVALASILIPLGLWLGENGVERALLAGVCVLVIIVELLNSAIEAVVDRIGPEKHPLSKIAKDTGSAAVSVALILWGITWLNILVPKWL
ncbi:diacylglycerol kinase [Biformimicrobium ophioploci]|uniref:Diacylglycerol kinase n=1 Tax=Biformimicrobium ophioploci TaxID=3036711 RepID=A0ABQ6LUM8_9GAMM|nr:diacylglycerol kinase [Microbulbifer sp. NKW57]GMG85747.1 diacylglycerol kinase [Microbulbifer sp. NKW57]